LEIYLECTFSLGEIMLCLIGQEPMLKLDVV